MVFIKLIRKLIVFSISESSIWADGIVCLIVGMLCGVAVELLISVFFLKGKYAFLVPLVLLILSVGRMLLAFLPGLGRLDALAFSSYAFTACIGSFITALLFKFLS